MAARMCMCGGGGELPAGGAVEGAERARATPREAFWRACGASLRFAAALPLLIPLHLPLPAPSCRGVHGAVRSVLGRWCVLVAAAA